MADPLGTLLQVVEVVGKVIEVYRKIQDAPEQIQRIGKRIGRLNTILVQLESLLRTDEERSLARLGPAMTHELLTVIKDIRNDSEEIQVLFVKWDRDIGPWGMQFRFKIAAQAYFALGSSSDRLDTLSNGIEEHRQDLRDLLQVMTGLGINQLLVGAPGPEIGSQPSPSPEPEAPRTDFRIIFVDPYNVARGVVAEAYTKLLREWTVRAGGDWRVKVAHSAGFFVRSRSEVVDTINGLKFSHPSYQLNIANGNAPPQPTPLAALFDNKLFDYPYKNDIMKEVESKRSRGISKTIFRAYDYILVFTDRDEDNMVRLRKTLVNSQGKGTVTAKPRGRVMHLGRYLTPDGMRKEIVTPKNDVDREQWNAKVAQIKTAVKAFLKKELDWKQPPPGSEAA
ncbi:hypothetical protein diail_9877, partial [Diaporthe ilicicola]